MKPRTAIFEITHIFKEIHVSESPAAGAGNKPFSEPFTETVPADQKMGIPAIVSGKCPG
jgi:hypothetical protein